MIANRGEIAVRIARAVNELGLTSVALYSIDDRESGHVHAADEAISLGARGPHAYLDAETIVATAIAAACDAIHPGYGFLSENACFARLCHARDIRFVGPSADAIERFGDKSAARRMAAEAKVPYLEGTDGPTSLETARSFMRSLSPGVGVMVKAVTGGGGRGIRPVLTVEALDEAFAVCSAEAKAAFGCGDVYVEQLAGRVRHIEVQVIGDATGKVIALGDRDCSAQRRRQKLVEVAPAPHLTAALRHELSAAAVRLGEMAAIDNVGTIEFLVDIEPASGPGFVFIEGNPRLQVEHTVTEEVSGVDLVQAQLRLARGETLADLGLFETPRPSGYAVQVRLNAEAHSASGSPRPSTGRLSAFQPPSGPGVRVDSFVYPGLTLSAAFDSMFAKLIVRAAGGTVDPALARARRALAEFTVDGVDTNIDLLMNILARPELAQGTLDTSFVERNWAELTAAASPRKRPVPTTAPARPDTAASMRGPAGAIAETAPISGLVVEFRVSAGDDVWVGRSIAVLESMKMRHIVSASVSGVVHAFARDVGDQVQEGLPLIFIAPSSIANDGAEVRADADPDDIRPDLQHVLDRHAFIRDENRPGAVARRRATGQRTARENLSDLFDAHSFHEYGALAIAAQRRRRTLEELMVATPADGIVGGVGTVNAHLFAQDKAQCVGLSYDFTVLAGTQGIIGHKKTDRILQVAREMQAPVVFFTEGGGGRPGDVDFVGVAGLDSQTFELFASMSGIAPRIGIASGRCFAGNAVLYGCCDLTIATENANIGLGGPAMVEGGGLGVFAPEDIGPIGVQSKNGSVDVRVADEAEAVRETKRLLAYFQGQLPEWRCGDQRLLRHALPEDRQQVYNMRKLVMLLADEGSVLELRQEFGLGILTFLVRIDGRPIGVIANNPHWLGGAIDTDAADKAARFMQLCEAFDLPLLSLCDTPGFMVGPASEAAAGMRHGARLFVVGAALTVPVMIVAVRKSYGLGAMAMCAGSFHKAAMAVAWPTAEFGGMGLEGAVKLGFRRELDAIDDPAAKAAYFAARLAEYYEAGRGTSVAQFMEIDAVIDPRDTRAWISRVLAKRGSARVARSVRYIDSW